MTSTRASTDDQHEPASSELDKNQKMKLRNRLSQRAFRRRQAEYLRHLRNRAEASQKPDNERVSELEEENGRLRAHITELQSRLEGVQVTLQIIASSSSKILGRSETSSSTALEAIQIPDLPFPTDVDSTIDIPTTDAIQARSNLIRGVLDSMIPIDPNLAKSPLQLQRIPNIWNFNYQIGSQSYVDAIESCASSRPTSGLRWVDSNSPISGHIQILKRLLLTKVKPTILDNRSWQTMALQGENDGIDNMASLPAPDIKTLFSSPEYAYLAFKQLKIDCGASYYKIDPVFFSKYPELCDPSDDIVATGVPLKPVTQTILTSPNYVNDMTVATYCSFINFSFDAATALSRLEYV
ncbi:hypothetical protein CEP53_013181 [Fusarium sp. AF-6]|nr:hypothetical protein CEP53_013181 [Fusarium sp. AF-6]